MKRERFYGWITKPGFFCKSRFKGNAFGFVLAVLMLCSVMPAASLAQEMEVARAVISFAGDCTLGSTNAHQKYGSSFVQIIGELGFDYPFSGVKHIFEADDLTLVNLEGTFTDSSKAQDKSFVFRAPPAYAEVLPLGSVEAVNIANNHIDDFFARGKEDTLAALDANGVLYSGEGILAVYEANGIKIGMTGYSYPHRNTLKDLEETDIPALREMGCDIIVFSMHAGTEEDYKLTGTQKVIARGAIDLGVDIVVGHHAHVIQTVEVYQGKPIFYGLGNFSFGGNSNPKDWDSLIGQVVVEKSAEGVQLVEMRIIPCLISEGTNGKRKSDFRPVVAGEEDKRRILDKLQKYAYLAPVDESIFEDGILSLEGYTGIEEAED